MGNQPDDNNTNAAHRNDTGGRDDADTSPGQSEQERKERSEGQQGGSKSSQGVPSENSTRQSPPGGKA